MTKDLRDFMADLKEAKDLIEIDMPISPVLEMTEIGHRLIQADGPAVLFNNPVGSKIPAVGNLFASARRVRRALGVETDEELREIGVWLSKMKEPEAPSGMAGIREMMSIYGKALWMLPKRVRRPRCQEEVIQKEAVDLSQFPIQFCWPEDVAPLITWGLVVTKGPDQKRTNMGVYRMQVLGKNRIIMRWLAHRGGALDYRAHCSKYPDQPFPISVVIGADPATILAAVIPIPDSLSEHQFAGLLRKGRSRVAKSLLSDLVVPESAEIVLEGFIYPNDTEVEGPFADHTGYYNEVGTFPVMTIEAITTRKEPIYLTTYTGKPMDEPAVMGVCLNEIFVPLLQKQYPEIVDFYLPPEGCSYRMAVVSMKKQYPGHPKRVMFGIWSFLRQFLYTKFIIVVDDDINIRNWPEVIWAITTRVDAIRDTTMIDHTPIDYLDFASPKAGLGSKMGIDATNKWPAETDREWGKVAVMDKSVCEHIDQIWPDIMAAFKTDKKE